MNIREVNELLILGLLSKEVEQMVALLEVADPGLQLLSPLAKAAWQLHSTNTISPEVAEAALDATFLVASHLPDDLLAGENICTFECEKVVHTLTIEVESKDSKRAITLSFASEGAIQCLMGGEAPLRPSLPMSEISFEQLKPNQLSESQFFDAYETIAIPASPAAYPCDTDFIGMLTYRLVEIGGQPVSGPCFTDFFNDFSCDDLGLLNDWPDSDEFCWLHQLTREQAEELALARRDGRQSDPSMPDWLRDDLTFSKVWITREDLKESYEKGTVDSYALDDILLCLGAGPGWQPWQPDDWQSEVDGLDTSLDLFPENQMPLKIIHLSKQSPCDDPDAGAILKLMSNLVSAYADHEA
jgi:hypothetical protein